jgi:hypothetical protein
VPEYRQRVIDRELDELLPQVSAVSLDGPKGVGKTATALRRAGTVRALDRPGVLSVLAADPGRLLAGDRPVLIDEWQRLPVSWDLVRRAVDSDPSPGRFLLTGSASPAEAGLHSGAGRIVRCRMRPFTSAERGLAQPTVSLSVLLTGDRPPLEGFSGVDLETYATSICQSGFPAIGARRGRALRAELDGYLDLIVERDFAELGHPVRRPITLRRWLAAYGAATATTASLEVIRDAATAAERDKPAKATVLAYQQVLERLWIVDPVPAWLPSRSHLRRLGAAPRHHLADPALAARLVGASAESLLGARHSGPFPARDGTLLGQLFESLVTLDVRVYAQAAEGRVGHLRTHGGEHEIDLIVERGDGQVLAVEVKLAHTVTDQDVRHLRWLREQIGEEMIDAIVVTTGREAYRRRDGIGVVPAALLGP